MTKKDYQEFKLKLNMKTILLYEEMSGKSFYEMSADDIMLLIYCALIVNNDLTITKKHFDAIMKNEKITTIYDENDKMRKFKTELKTKK